MAVTIAVITAVYCLTLCAFRRCRQRQGEGAPAAGARLERLAGVFLVGFGIRLGRQ
jgi:leucine efflux protein